MSTLQTSQTVMNQLLEGNEQFVHEHKPAYFEPFRDKQTPKITLVTCSDSRVHGNVFHIDPNNQIFTIRNIGNQLLNNMGSVDYGIHHLHTPLLVIMGHTHCGAVKAALHTHDQELHSIIHELAHLLLPLQILAAQKQAIPSEELWLKGVEMNVHYQVSVALKKYQPLVQEGKLHVVGVIDDIINAYHRGHGRLIVINIDGQSSPQQLRQSPLLEQIAPNLRMIHTKPHSDHDHKHR